jgi:hypothetical protein
MTTVKRFGSTFDIRGLLLDPKETNAKGPATGIEYVSLLI